MIAILTVLVALPLGLAIRSRTSAMLAYLSLYLWTYTFQTGYLTRAWVEGDTAAFSRPADLGLEYGLVTGAIGVLGCGLVALGHRVAVRRRDRRTITSSATGSSRDADSAERDLRA